MLERWFLRLRAAGTLTIYVNRVRVRTTAARIAELLFRFGLAFKYQRRHTNVAPGGAAQIQHGSCHARVYTGGLRAGRFDVDGDVPPLALAKPPHA